MTPEVTAPGAAMGAGELPESAFRLIVDGNAHAFSLIGRDGTIRYAAASVEPLLGWKACEVIGRNMAEFLRPDQIELALETVAEIDELDRAGAGVPMVFAVVRGDGRTSWLEIGAMPMLDVPGVDGIVLRMQAWDAQHHFDTFLAALLADHPLPIVLSALSRSIAGSLQAEGAAVHHGFDGAAFAAADGDGVPAASLSLDDGPWCEAVLEGVPVNVEVADLPPALAGPALAAGLRSCWVVPVPTGDVAPAALSVWRAAEGGPLIGHRHVLERSTRYAELALVRTAEHQRLRYLAGHDALTGVANRVQFRDRLAHALAIGESALAVAFCDLDNFKPVNDTFGHSAGDAALVQVAERLRASLRTGDELARVGGDEFTVLLRNVPDTDAAQHVGDRLLAALADPIEIGEERVGLGISVGIALAQPSTTAEDLLARADAALYQAKRSGGMTAHVDL
jgi:diguanylate cyclase (GGDEF)-like protein/PAS domain S-box-containing protein